MDRRFVIISGLPGSGKTTLGRRLAQELRLPLLDKDDFLTRLLEAQGSGNRAWRRNLSRDSDRMLQAEAARSAGAVVVSFWRQSGMASDSGTPTDWLSGLSALVVNVHCSCPIELAAKRFFERTRHPGHLDAEVTLPEVLASLGAQELFDPIDVGPRVEVDTSTEPDMPRLVGDIEAAFTRGPTPACGRQRPVES
jgi:glucokinase